MCKLLFFILWQIRPGHIHQPGHFPLRHLGEIYEET
jgi:hypothetical protein